MLNWYNDTQVGHISWFKKYWMRWGRLLLNRKARLILYSCGREGAFFKGMYLGLLPQDSDFGLAGWGPGIGCLAVPQNKPHTGGLETTPWEDLHLPFWGYGDWSPASSPLSSLPLIQLLSIFLFTVNSFSP